MDFRYFVREIYRKSAKFKSIFPQAVAVFGLRSIFTVFPAMFGVLFIRSKFLVSIYSVFAH